MTTTATAAFTTLSAAAQQLVLNQQAGLKFLASRGYEVSQRGLAGHVAYYGNLA